MSRLRASITGIGMSQVGRETHRPAMAHLADAAIEAITDAGLKREDIDGICTYPGRSDTTPGLSPLGCAEVRHGLGLTTRWHSSTHEGPAQMSPLMVAAMAVSTGQARHVLCFRALTESSSQTGSNRASVPGSTGKRAGGWLSYLLPMNAVSASTWAGWMATRYFHEFGMTREHLGAIAVNQRTNALLNSRALMRKPLTLDEYMAARMIASPLSLFDCDIPIDGACAIVISAADAARDCAKPPLHVEAMGAALRGAESWDQRADLTTMAAHDAAADLWNRTDLTPENIDVWALYDGFSIFVPLWLEALGCCEHGAAKHLIEAGELARGGRFPVNTGGGQLSAGRLHGFGHFYELCVQLRGEAGERQVAGATTGVCGMGGGFLAGTMLLRRD